MQKNFVIGLINKVVFNGDSPQVHDWEKAFLFAKSHSLGTIFYYATKDRDDLPEQVRKACLRHYLAQINQQAGQDYLREKLYQAFKSHQIKFAPIKGLALRDLYPKSDMRTSCDVDFLYAPDQKNNVEKVLTDFGFTKISENINHGEWTSGIVTVENHHALFDHDDRFAGYYNNVWSMLTTTDQCEYNFSKEDFYVYFIVHSAKHFLSGGFGIRTVLDIYLYNQKIDFDKDNVQQQLQTLGLCTFEKQILALAEYWFNDGQATQDLLDIEKYVFSSGTYGTVTNASNVRANHKNASDKKAKLAFWLRTIFPSYASMKSAYPILKKAWVLLPILWVYRWFAVLFTRPKRIKKTITSSKSVSKSQVEFIQHVKQVVGIEE